MNLHDCKVPYIRLPDATLKLKRKVELVQAIGLYRIYDPDPEKPVRIAIREDAADALESPFATTAYQRRQRAETLHALERAGLLRHGKKTGTLELVPAPETEGRILVPAECEYANLSAVAIKTLLACHRETRYRRKDEAFRLVMEYVKLAKLAGVSERRLQDALTELQRHHLLETWSHKQRRHWLKQNAAKLPAKKRKPWQSGTQITLKEPNSDTPLYYLGDWHTRYLDKLPPMERYKILLSRYDSKGELSGIRGDAELRGYHVDCPFCHKKKTFTFTCREDEDVWRCFHCNRKGNSRTLWAKLSNWKDRPDWRTVIPQITGQDAGQDAAPEIRQVNLPDSEDVKQEKKTIDG